MKNAMKTLLTLAVVIIAMFATSMTVAASDNTMVITETASRGIVIYANDNQVLCYQRYEAHPYVGTRYTSCNANIASDKIQKLERLHIAAYLTNDGSSDFRAAYAIATWTITDNASTNIGKLYGGANVVAKCENLLSLANEVNVNDYIVTVEYWAADGYQMLALPRVEKKMPTTTTTQTTTTTTTEAPTTTSKPTTTTTIGVETLETTMPMPTTTTTQPVVVPTEPTIPETEVTTTTTTTQPTEEITTTTEPTTPETTITTSPEPTEPEVLPEPPHKFPEAPKTGDELTTAVVKTTSALTVAVVLFVIIVLLVASIKSKNEK